MSHDEPERLAGYETVPHLVRVGVIRCGPPFATLRRRIGEHRSEIQNLETRVSRSSFDFRVQRPVRMRFDREGPPRKIRDHQ